MKTFSKLPSEKNMKQVNCAVCGSASTKKPWKKGYMNFVKCVNCGLVYQNPQPEAGELVDRYDAEYFDYEIRNEGSFFNLMKLGLDDIDFFTEESRIFTDCKQKGLQPSFLDIGCATGRLILEMSRRGWKASGVEVCAQSAGYGIEKHGLDIKIGPVEAASFPDNTFDVVYCSHLIEHLTSPAEFTSEAARILKPGGLFIVTTPDISGFQSRLFKSEWRSAIADHMYLFSGRTLSQLMNNGGFNIMKTATWGGLAAGTAPVLIKKAADKLVKCIGAGDVICIMGLNQGNTIDTIY